MALRVGRRVDILYDGPSMMPITVTVMSDAEVVDPFVRVDGFGGLTPPDSGYERVVKFYSDLGWRTVALRHISVR